MIKIINLAENKIYDRDVQEGRDIDGFDKDGYDRGGYDEDGCDRRGYDEDGYNKTGFDIHGNYNKKFDRRSKQGRGLKIKTPKRILSRLPVVLSEIHAGNKSIKLKNEIRQLLYSLYRSKKISKTIYNNLIATV